MMDIPCDWCYGTDENCLNCTGEVLQDFNEDFLDDDYLWENSEWAEEETGEVHELQEVR